MSESILKHTSETGGLLNFDFDPVASKTENTCVCEACILGKMHQLPHTRLPRESYDNPIRVAVIDALIKPSSVSSADGCTGFLSIIFPGCLNYTMGFGFVKRSEIAGYLKYAQTFIERRFPNHKLETWLCDQAGEHRPTWWLEHCKDLGVQITFAATEEHQSIGLVEGWNRILMDRYRARSIHAKSPPSLWVYGLTHECMIRNYFVPKHATITPYEMVHKRKPSASNLKNLFCVAYARILPKNRSDKASPRAQKGRFLGCTPDWAPVTTLGFILLLDDKNLKNIVISRDVYFLEDLFDLATTDPIPLEKPTTWVAPPDMPVILAPVDATPESDLQNEEPSNSHSLLKSNAFSPKVSVAVNDERDAEPVAPSRPESPSLFDDQFLTPDVSFAQPSDPPSVAGEEDDSVAGEEEDLFQTALPVPGDIFNDEGDAESPAGESSDLVPSTQLVESIPTIDTRRITRSQRPNGIGTWTDVLNGQALNITVEHSFYAIPGPKLKIALQDPIWRAALDAELANFAKFGVFQLAPRTPSHKPCPTLWVLTTKINEETGAEKHKARLVMDGSRQRPGIDYTATYAATPELASFKIFLSITVHRKMIVIGADAQSAHLQAPSDIQGCINIPVGMDVPVPDPQNYVLELKQTMYGQCQAPLQWEKHRNQHLLAHGFEMSPHDPCIFKKQFGKFMILIHTHADDFAIAYDEPIKAEFTSFITQLTQQLHLKVQDRLSLYLGVVVTFSPDWSSVELSQADYVTRILSEFHEFPTRRNRNPWSLSLDAEFDADLPQSDEDKSFFADGKYNKVVGKLIYLLVTRPELAYYVGKLSRFLKAPRQIHWRALQYLLGHLNGAPDLVTRFQRDSAISVADATTHLIPPAHYSDADWAGDLGTRRSTSGKLTLINGTAILSGSKRQSVVADSTVAAETIALCTIAKDAVWVRDFLIWLGYKLPAAAIACDNQGTISNTNDGALRSKTKHMDLKYMFLRDLVRRGLISISYVSTNAQIADIFTKPLKWIKFQEFRSAIGVNFPSIITPAKLKGSMTDSSDRLTGSDVTTAHTTAQFVKSGE